VACAARGPSRAACAPCSPAASSWSDRTERVARGGDAAAGSYDAFLAAADLRDVDVGSSEVDEFCELAFATVPWRMTYAINGTEYRDRGHDVYALRAEHGDWRICWRHLVVAESVRS
jgi:hypothetical protein